MNLQLDKWQEEVIATEGNMCLRSGRQVGKSTVIALKAALFAMNNPNMTVMVIASVERQALLLFEKILANVYEINKLSIKRGKDRPTKHKINLKNGSVIHCLPTGESGFGIRGFTINLLIADEAAFINEEVWTAVTPMLTITRGDIWLLSTPHGREGYYYRCFGDDTFTSFHISAEDCPRKDQTFLDHEKEWMTKAQYAQEYLGEFVSDLRQFFTDELIKKSCILARSPGSNEVNPLSSSRDYFLGVDVARLGEDASTFEILDATDHRNITQVDNISQYKNLTTDTTDKIITLDTHYNFRKIYIDEANVGGGVFDQLFVNPVTKRRVVGIDNARKSVDSDRKKRIIKEDLYNNLLRLMERGEIKLLNDDDLRQSLKCIQFEYVNGRMKIWGSPHTFTHIAEGIVRAAWCVKDKSLKLWVRWL